MNRIVATLLLTLGTAIPVVAQDIHPAYADDELTCEEMQADPYGIFAGGGPDLGSGHGSPLEVEYSCEGSLESLDFLASLRALAEQIRGGEGTCGGTLSFARHRYHLWGMLAAGLAPRTLLANPPSPGSREKLRDYLDFWGHSSASNYRLYARFVKEAETARRALTSHYRREHGFSAAEARTVADLAVWQLEDRAAGSYPEVDDNGDEARLPEFARLLLQDAPHSRVRDALGEASQRDRHIALRVALLQGHARSTVELLLASVLEVDAIPVPGQGDETALFFALGDRRVLDQVLARGAGIDRPNDFGKTALYYAIESGNIGLVSRLLELGADPNHRYHQNGTDRHACRYRITHTGRTPLMHAAQHGSARMIQLLIRNGARVEELDDLGYSALDFALEHERHAQARRLRREGAVTVCRHHIYFQREACPGRQDVAQAPPPN